MELDDGGLGELAKRVVEGNFQPPAGPAIEQSPGWNHTPKHFFEAQGLGTELDFVGVVGFWPAALVLDGVWHFLAAGRSELHDIRFSKEPQPEGSEREGPADTEVSRDLGFPAIGLFMQMPALDGERVLGPEPLDVDQRALSRAEQEVLQGADGKKIFFGEHITPILQP